jgi:hypothetical protein
MSALAYKYFENGVPVLNTINNFSYQCKICKKRDIEKHIKAKKYVTSNLLKHLRSTGHDEVEPDVFNQTTLQFFSPQVKRTRLFDTATENVAPTIKEMKTNYTLTSTSIKVNEKYHHRSFLQKERFTALVKMLVKCMLPISFVETEGFYEWLSVVDPCFRVPTSYTIRETGIPSARKVMIDKMRQSLNDIKYPNVSLDGWSDAGMKPFMGYMVQGINSEWDLVHHFIDFSHYKGKIKKS